MEAVNGLKLIRSLWLFEAQRGHWINPAGTMRGDQSGCGSDDGKQ